ncbi:hypothetical protein RJ641_024424, partial [Dillenia turbinata]
MDCLTEFFQIHMDCHPRKRPKLGWSVNQTTKAQSGLFCGKPVGNPTSYAFSRLLADHSNLYVKGLPQNGSPPWCEDDKDGHYMFAHGENLTTHKNI